MLKIRLQRIGRRNNPSYRVVVTDSRRAANKGNIVELLGTHDTIRKQTTLKEDRIKYWISLGAQVSDTMNNILVKNAVIEGVMKNVLPRKTPIQKGNEKSDSEEQTQQEPPTANSNTVVDKPDEDVETPAPQNIPSEEG